MTAVTDYRGHRRKLIAGRRNNIELYAHYNSPSKQRRGTLKSEKCHGEARGEAEGGSPCSGVQG